MEPFFSIVVPAYNRPAELNACLDAISGITYPKDRFEVIVVDDGSRAPLENIVSAYSNRIHVKGLRQKNSGPAVARNTGLEKAKGDYIAFTDDDCRPAPDWLSILADTLCKFPGCAVAGRPVNALDKNVFSTASQLIVDYLFEYYNSDPSRPRLGTTNNLVFPAHRLKELGGFDTNFRHAAGEDREICRRWCAHGYPLIFAPQAVVFHFHQLKLHTFFRQHVNYGRGAFLYQRIQGRRSKIKINIEPIRFYLDLIRYPSQYAVGSDIGKIQILFILSQIANVFGFVRGMLDYK